MGRTRVSPTTSARNAATDPDLNPPHAIKLLKADHIVIRSLFSEYGRTTSVGKKKLLVARICAELAVHTQIEEEIFFPAVKQALKDKVLIPEATVEHDTLKFLMSQLLGATVDENFNARIRVLSAYVAHHVIEEHNLLFRRAASTKLNMLQLGAKMVVRKAELLAIRR